MKAIIRFNGRELPDTLCIVNSGENTVILDTPVTREGELDMYTHAVEVNIFGELPEQLESNWDMLFDEKR